MLSLFYCIMGEANFKSPCLGGSCISNMEGKGRGGEMNRPDPHPFHSLKAHTISHEKEFTPSHPPKMPSSLLEVKEAKHRGYLSAYQPFDEMLLRCNNPRIGYS